jgi:hypothetical protein
MSKATKGSFTSELIPADKQNETRRNKKKAAKAASSSTRNTGTLGASRQDNRHQRWDHIKLGAVAPSVMTPVKTAAPKSVRTSTRPTSDDVARDNQRRTAFASLNLTSGSYEETITLQFMDQWSKATPVKVEGRTTVSRTRLALDAVYAGLPAAEAKSRQVKDILGAAAKAICDASR